VTHTPRRVAGTALLVALGVGAAIAGTAFVGAPEEVVRDRPEQVEPVVRSSAVCPYVGGEARASSRLAVLALDGVDEPDWEPPADQAGDDTDEDALLVVRRLAGPDDEPDPFLTVAERGEPVGKAVERNNPAAFGVHAEGPMAPGVVAEQYMLAQGPDLRGLVTAACTIPAREHWFVGASAEPGQRGRLILSNAASTTAVVTVSLWDDVGLVETVGTKDISIPARSQEVLLLDALAGETEQLGVRVRASQGRVAAAVDHRVTVDGAPHGISMIPVAAAPSTSVVVPGVPGHGERTLHLIAPGDTDAIVSVRVLGTEGPFSPLDHDLVTVPAGAVTSVPIGDAVGDTPAAIELDSDEEITAAVRVVSTGEDGLPEIAYTAAAPALPAGPTAAILSRDTSSVSSRLLLTAVGDMGGRATVTVLDADGAVVDEQVVDVMAGSTADIELESGEETSWAIAVVRPAAAGTVVAVREMSGSDSDGALLDLMPLVAPELTVRVPEVAGELPAGLRPPERIER
jgi:hypothetical protein